MVAGADRPRSHSLRESPLGKAIVLVDGQENSLKQAKENPRIKIAALLFVAAAVAAVVCCCCCCCLLLLAVVWCLLLLLLLFVAACCCLLFVVAVAADNPNPGKKAKIRDAQLQI